MRGIMKTVAGNTIRIKCQKPGPKPLPESMKKRRVNVALSPYWHERGKALAAASGKSFSAFVEDLVIYADSLCNESG